MDARTRTREGNRFLTYYLSVIGVIAGKSGSCLVRHRPVQHNVRPDCTGRKQMNITRILWVVVSLCILTEGTCICAADPVFVTSDPNGGRTMGNYYVHNNMWNSAKYSPCTSTLYARSWNDWYVITKMNNKTGDGAVKTYPNVHRDYHSVPISSFDLLSSSFAESSPRVGIYDITYDIWINGIAKPGCTEIMIWAENFNQVPAGRHVSDAMFGGQSYKVYKTHSGGYIAFVATTNFTSGTVDLLDIMKWTMAKGWLSPKSTLNQVCFGVEMVSTDDAEARFQVTRFSIDEKDSAGKKHVGRVPQPGDSSAQCNAR